MSLLSKYVLDPLAKLVLGSVLPDAHKAIDAVLEQGIESMKERMKAMLPDPEEAAEKIIAIPAVAAAEGAILKGLLTALPEGSLGDNPELRAWVDGLPAALKAWLTCATAEGEKQFVAMLERAAAEIEEAL